MKISNIQINIISVLLFTVIGYSQKPSVENRHLEFNNLKLARSAFFGTKKLKRSLHDKPLLRQKAFSGLPFQDPRAKALGFSRDMINHSYDKNLALELDAEIVAEYLSPAGNHIRLKQTVNGIPVYGAEMSVSVNRETGDISSVSTAFADVLNIKSTRPSISQTSALEIAENYLQASKERIFQQIDLTFVNTLKSGYRLAYLVWLVPRIPLGEWNVFVDANSGEILHVANIAKYDSGKKTNGAAKIWNPDPLTTAEVPYGGAYQDFNDADTLSLNSERLDVELKDITLTENGYMLEGPYVKLIDAEAPYETFPVLADSSQFNFTRSQQEFEDVMVYYHIDKSYRHLLDLGFSIPGLLEFKADPHGLNGQDNSHYIAGPNYVAFGEGGVDDAEDADVIWHEYAHAIQQWTMGGLDRSGEALSLAEGSSDYWAVSYSRSKSDYSWGKVFTWDGHNEFWDGRWANLSPENGHYPEDYAGGYAGAPLWSSALMEIWENLGREVTDKLFIQAHYYWLPTTGLQEAAATLLQADQELYDSAHFNTLYTVLESRGLIDASHYAPLISHTPLKDSENIEGPYRVVAEILENVITADTSSFKVFYSYVEESAFTPLSMSRLGSTDDFYADIPSADTSVFNVWYYISAANDSGEVRLDPENAPASKHMFRVFKDSIPPVITHTPLLNQVKELWPTNVWAIVTDNLGVDSVWIEYYFYNQTGIDSGEFGLNVNFDDGYNASFPLDTIDISIGDSVQYRILAKDQAAAQNIKNSPEGGFYSFKFIPYKGVILLVDDEIGQVGKEPYLVSSTKGNYYRDYKKEDSSPYVITNTLCNYGYTVIPMSMSDAITMDLSSFDLVIHSSGGNEVTMANTEYRTHLVNWMQQDSLARLLVEGGEIGYNWYTDQSVSENILHISNWITDYVGNYEINPSYKNHEIKSGEYILPDSIKIDLTGYGDQDAVLVSEDAYFIYNTSDGNNYPGIIVYNPFGEFKSAQTVYLPFSGTRIDSTVFSNLVVNSVDFLMKFKGTVSAINDPDPDDQLPNKFVLHQNYPNPFNPSTTIRFDIPQASRVSINIYNITGQRVKSLLNGNFIPGNHEVIWDGKNDNGIFVSSGIYFYQLKSENNVLTKRMLLLK